MTTLLFVLVFCHLLVEDYQQRRSRPIIIISFLWSLRLQWIPLMLCFWHCSNGSGPRDAPQYATSKKRGAPWHSWKGHVYYKKEKDCVTAKEKLSSGLSNLVNDEINQQVWQGEMASKASGTNLVVAKQGMSQCLLLIKRNVCFKQGSCSNVAHST